MKPPPKGYPRMTASVIYKNGAAAIDWLVKALGFEVRIRVDGEGGRIEYCELELAGAVLSVSEEQTQVEKHREMVASPLSVGGKNTIFLHFYVEDVDAVCERARAAGGVITYEPKVSDYGEDYWADKSCQIRDPEGHHWWFSTRMRDRRSS